MIAGGAAFGADAGEPEPAVTLEHGGWVWAVAFSPDGRHLATGATDNKAKLWELARPSTPTRVFDAGSSETLPSGHGPWIESVAFDSRGDLLMTSGRGSVPRLWQLSNPRTPLRSFPKPEDVVQAALSADAQWLLGAGFSFAVLWDARSQQSKPRVLPHPGVVEAVNFAPDSRHFLTGCQDKLLRLWDAQDTSAPLAGYPHPSWISAGCFSPDKKRILSGCYSGSVELWDVDQTTTAIATLPGHSAMVRGVAFSPDGKYLLTGANDSTARLWDARDTRAPLAVLKHPGWVAQVCFSPDAKRFATGCYDGKARVWDLASFKR